MCLGIPTRVISTSGDLAKVEIGGVEREVSIMLLDGVKEGDWVIIHAGFAIERLDAKDAEETLALLKEIADGAEISG
ncbi:MAG: HypC/HybG/HupF family hydrogenase formation chaperone [Deltaproteobacteria bacterium]|nr:HypC/HybG/HupF family hydrogenase formation chaperone [Deltaproteobacteria bacterium]NIS77530.1 HypC/HybG/HupF family hydrogenase formation chaperone [Deltaproteobacteria bacterium]